MGGNKRLLCPEVKSRECLKQGVCQIRRRHRENGACLSAQSCPTLQEPLGLQPPGSSVCGIFPGKTTGVGCHFIPPKDLPNPGIKPTSPASPALGDRFFTTESLGSPETELDQLNLRISRSLATFTRTVSGDCGRIENKILRIQLVGGIQLKNFFFFFL